MAERTKLSRPKRHHYVPRFYLEGFIDPANPPYIWVYEKGNAAIKALSAENIAVQGHYYSVRFDDGRIETEAEAILGELEALAAPVFQTIAARNPVGETDREYLALFLAFQFVRVPNFRNNVEAVMRQCATDWGKELASRPEDLAASIDRFQRETGKTVSLPIEKLREFLLGNEYTVAVNPSVSLEHMELAAKIAPLLYAMKWTFLVAPKDTPFVTSDNPVNYNRSGGLKNPDVQVSAPLTREIALVATWKHGAGRYCKAPPSMVREINRRTIVAAERFVYAPLKSDKLNGVVQKFRDSAPKMRVK